MLFTAADAVFFCFWGSVFCPGKKVKAMKTPVSRVGNKTPILNILYAVFPIDYTRYIDVFGGSGSVLLGKPRIDPFEVYNDYDRNLANLFRCMKYRTMALIRELGFCTLNSRDDFHSMCQFLNNEPFAEPHMEEELELTEIMLPPVYAKQINEMRQRISGDCDVRRAAMFLRTLRTSYSSQGTSFACQPFDIRKLFTLIQQAGDRLSEVIVENQDYQILIPHYQSTGIVLHTQEIIVLNEVQIMGKFFIPGGLCSGLTAGNRLQVVHGEGQTNLNVGVHGFNDLLGCLMALHSKKIAVLTAA